jgi:hypothetical protein
LERTFRAESVPLLVVALFWSIQASASAAKVTVLPQSTGGGSTMVHEYTAGSTSTLPARSIARTANAWSATLKPA